MEFIEIEKRPTRTPMAKDVKEILAQNRMILELNMRMFDEMIRYLKNPIATTDPTFTGLSDTIKDKGPGSQL